MNLQVIQDGRDIAGTQGKVVCSGFMRLIAGTMSSRIDEDQSIVAFQRIYVAKILPILATSQRAVL